MILVQEFISGVREKRRNRSCRRLSKWFNLTQKQEKKLEEEIISKVRKWRYRYKS